LSRSADPIGIGEGPNQGPNLRESQGKSDHLELRRDAKSASAQRVHTSSAFGWGS